MLCDDLKGKDSSHWTTKRGKYTWGTQA